MRRSGYVTVATKSVQLPTGLSDEDVGPRTLGELFSGVSEGIENDSRSIRR
jgi:hypothetical protein